MKEFAILSNDTQKGLQLLSLIEESFEIKGVLVKDSVQLIRELEEMSNPIVLLANSESNSIDEIAESYLREKNVKIILESTNNRICSDENYFQISNLYSKKELEKVLILNGICVQAEKNEKFCRVQLSNCFKLNIAPSDIYLKLNEDHFVKIINESDLFTDDVLNKYLNKNIKFFYVKNEDSIKYYDDVTEMLTEMYGYKINNPNDEIHIASLNHIVTLAREIGLTDSSIRLASELISSVCLSLSKSLELKHSIEKLVDVDSSISRHSLSVAVVACSIAENLDWQSEHTMRKLVTASILHDLSLKKEYLITIDSTESNFFSELSKEDQEQVLSHPINSCEFIKGIEGSSSNIDTIILQHHERAGGKGFPKGLNGNQIAPLSCIFILAEDFYNRLIQHGTSKASISKILRDMGEIYIEGNFKKTFNSLVSCFL